MGCCASKKDHEQGNGDQFPQDGGLFSQRLAEIYRKYDTNHDGSLDRDQTRALLNQVLQEQGKTVSENDLEEFINAADTNRDGKIQKKQLYQLYKKLQRHNRGKR